MAQKPRLGAKDMWHCDAMAEYRSFEAPSAKLARTAAMMQLCDLYVSDERTDYYKGNLCLK